ncbi:hypothetical protein J2X72_003929 [Phyllobacterium sp. 1468]|uniref:hypothetical protein n=1 Tax=Phyllobacterium sp. 1468 TaxID=2817759 RepID=UPI00285CF337|nr:hypothetical protein [Phyllobacterium sp. 1468]MDR6635117.1 hypothetical protein [Phyllobacterium sp. 1468]
MELDTGMRWVTLKTFISMLPAHLTGKFKTIINDIQNERQFSTFDFRQIDIRPVISFNGNGLRPSKLATYTSKFLDFNNEKLLVEEDIQIYPRPRKSRGVMGGKKSDNFVVIKNGI